MKEIDAQNKAEELAKLKKVEDENKKKAEAEKLRKI